MSAPPSTTLRRAVDADAATILRWRNHPEVRRVMFTEHEISAAEHARWWASLKTRDDYQLLVIEHKATPCGVVTFSRCADDNTAWLWGFYLDPDGFADGLERLRAWNGMEVASLAWAQAQLAANEVRCEVFAFNTAVLQMHLRHRFRETGRYQRRRGEAIFEVVQLARKP